MNIKRQSRDHVPHLSGNLRRLREAAGLTQDQIADACGLRQSTVSAFERGRHVPSLRMCLLLAEALGVSLGDLAAGKKGRPCKVT
jgi:transcriptional regulator with XRE-family HTH domain